MTLDDCLLHPLASPLLATFMALGLAGLTAWISKWMRRFADDWTTLHTAALFFGVSGALGSFIQILAIIQRTSRSEIAPLAWILAGLGIIFLTDVWRARAWKSLLQKLKLAFGEGDFWLRAAILLSGIIGSGLFLNAIAPATDADSLAYHLAGPLDMLRHHGAYYRGDWVDMRLLGVGECLNLLGLAGGSDCFGSVLQFAGLMLLVWGIASLARDSLTGIFLSIGILGVPMLVMLVNAQKPQMFPIAASVLGGALLVRRRSSLDRMTFLLSFGALCCAISMKYSFVLTAGAVCLVGLEFARRQGTLLAYLPVALLAVVGLLAPVYGKNWMLFGDPLSPLLERFFSTPDVLAVRFAELMKTYSLNNIPFPVNLLIPDGNIHYILGLGIFLTPVVCRKTGEPRWFLFLALLAGTTTFILSQRTARFFLEPYFWILCAGASLPWPQLPRWLFRGIVIQMIPVAGIVWFGVASLLPGLLSREWREAVMHKAAYGFSEGRWLDTVLPPDACLLHAGRTNIFLPRMFFAREPLMLINFSSESEWNRIFPMIKMIRPTFLTSYRELNLDGLPLDKIQKIAENHELRTAGRKPWWQGQKFSLFAYRIDVMTLSETDLRILMQRVK